MRMPVAAAEGGMMRVLGSMVMAATRRKWDAQTCNCERLFLA
jgi:hypothetical protein